MAYLSYEEYMKYGGTLPQSEFTLAEYRAEKRIDYLTDSRIKGMEQVPEAVKLCVLAIIGMESVVGTEAQVSSPVVTSYNTDGYSESYGKAMGAAEAEQALNRTVKSYLSGEMDDYGVPLLYRGLNAPQYFRPEEEKR
jgi:hypothetical protein